MRYNAEDVAVLLPLAALTYNWLARELPFDSLPAPVPAHPAVDLPYDWDLVESLVSRQVNKDIIDVVGKMSEEDMPEIFGLAKMTPIPLTPFPAGRGS